MKYVFTVGAVFAVCCCRLCCCFSAVRCYRSCCCFLVVAFDNVLALIWGGEGWGAVNNDDGGTENGGLLEE